jgi:hypothetical protein
LPRSFKKSAQNPITYVPAPQCRAISVAGPTRERNINARLFARGGVKNEDYTIIHTAVVHHCLPKELDRAHAHWRLTSLLKDADALDRVRLGDLDPRYLRNVDAQSMAGFAQALFDRTDGVVATGDDHFAALWPEAVRISSARHGRGLK